MIPNRHQAKPCLTSIFSLVACPHAYTSLPLSPDEMIKTFDASLDTRPEPHSVNLHTEHSDTVRTLSSDRGVGGGQRGESLGAAPLFL